MSEVDRLNPPDLHPALPIADRQRGRHDHTGRPPPGPPSEDRNSGKGQPPAAPTPHPPKSIIDEYA
jgi:hypothetical protein